MTEQKQSRFLDQQFAIWVVENFSAHLKAADKALLQHLVEAVSYATHLKHSCIDLDVYGDLKDAVINRLLEKISPAKVKTLITIDVKVLMCSNDGKKIWLQKYHGFEESVAQKLLQMRVEQRIQLITGGPGTGKTWTAAQEINQQRAANPAIHILLAAPTGKAANNMMLALAKSGFKTDNTDIAINAKTLHALLGMNRESPKSRYNHDSPLVADMVIIDEASMIDLPMMFRLLQAIPPHAKLLLLGDKDQLASVEAGSVLHEICSAPSFSGSIKTLTESRRYKESPEIGILANALNNGVVPDMSTNKSVLRHTLTNDNVWNPSWLPAALEHFKTIENNLATKTPEVILTEQAHFQILCALREGPQGVYGINVMLAKALGHKPDDWYEGRPVMITQNDHDRKLYNGDVGMILKLNNELKFCFMVDGRLKAISRAQMPSHETCYALTIHKSQGSEYERVMIILPAELSAVRSNPVLTKELVYTAVTRAKKSIALWCGEGVLEAVAGKTLRRMSGLSEMLGVLPES